MKNLADLADMCPTMHNTNTTLTHYNTHTTFSHKTLTQHLYKTYTSLTQWHPSHFTQQTLTQHTQRSHNTETTFSHHTLHSPTFCTIPLCTLFKYLYLENCQQLVIFCFVQTKYPAICNGSFFLKQLSLCGTYRYRLTNRLLFGQEDAEFQFNWSVGLYI